MPFNIENFIKKSLVNIDFTNEIIGLDYFLKSLEYHYFSTIKLKSKTCTSDSIHLVLEMNCNLDLLELFSHFSTDRWGNNIKNQSPLQYCLNILDANNDYNIDIEELTLALNDTSIVIKRIHNKSIPSQLNEIIKQIACNYVFLTRGLTQKPYEIFVPVYEENIEDSELDHHFIEIAPTSYFEYWGIYLDKDDESSIYDVNRNTYVSGDLEFLTE